MQSPRRLPHSIFLPDQTPIRIRLQTPYRERRNEDHLDFVLETWVKGAKVLNFEWGRGWEPWLRFLRAGHWVDDLTAWKLADPQATQAAQQRVAAE